MRDTLFLLDPAIPDPGGADTMRFCKDCMIVEGLLAAFPAQAARLDVVRVPYPRPRDAMIAVAGRKSAAERMRFTKDFCTTRPPSDRLLMSKNAEEVSSSRRPRPGTW